MAIKKIEMHEEKIISCPNCYRSQRWSGDLKDVACINCRRTIPLEKLAKALLHLFCAPTYNNPNANEDYELLTWLDDTGWGDAFRIGRHDWVLAGCPITTRDFCECIRQSDELRLMAVSRLLSQNELPGFLKHSSAKIGQASIDRLEMETNQDSRERLYYILKNFPDNRFLSALEQVAAKYPRADGDPDTPVGGAYEQAFESCAEAKGI